MHHRTDKNGRSRFAPIIGDYKQAIIDRMKNTAPNENVWKVVPSNADIHGYRSDYATAIYKMYARPIEEIPYDKVNKGTGRAYQSEVYVCRKDEVGKKLDKAAMEKARNLDVVLVPYENERGMEATRNVISGINIYNIHLLYITFCIMQLYKMLYPKSICISKDIHKTCHIFRKNHHINPFP